MAERNMSITISSTSEHDETMPAQTPFTNTPPEKVDSSRSNVSRPTSPASRISAKFSNHFSRTPSFNALRVDWRMNKPVEEASRSVVRLATGFVNAWQYRHFMSVMILTNVVEIGCQTEFTSDEMESVWISFDHFYTVVFALEMVLKLVAKQMAYFHDRWNILDFFLAWVGIVDSLLTLFVSGASVNQLTVIRVFRLCKITRMLKVLTIERQLQILVEGITASLRSMFWIGLLLALILYAFGIFCVTTLGNEEEYKGLVHFDEKEFFGNIPRAMITLFNVALLAEWDVVVRGVYDKAPELLFVFVVFVIFTSCGILNVIIGVIVDQTNQAGQRLHDEDLNMQQKEQLKAVELLSDIMYRSDIDHDGYLSMEETLGAVHDESFRLMINAIRLPKGFGIRELYTLLDQNADQRLSRTEFIEGTYQLIFSNEFQRACLTQLSIAQVKAQVRKLQEGIEKKIDRSFQALSRDIQALAHDARVPVDKGESCDDAPSQAACVERTRTPSFSSVRSSLVVPLDEDTAHRIPNHSAKSECLDIPQEVPQETAQLAMVRWDVLPKTRQSSGQAVDTGARLKDARSANFDPNSRRQAEGQEVNVARAASQRVDGVSTQEIDHVIAEGPHRRLPVATLQNDSNGLRGNLGTEAFECLLSMFFMPLHLANFVKPSEKMPSGYMDDGRRIIFM